MRPFNKTTATLVRPHPFSTLCPTPIGNSPVWCQPITAHLHHAAVVLGADHPLHLVTPDHSIGPRVQILVENTLLMLQ